MTTTTTQCKLSQQCNVALPSKFSTFWHLEYSFHTRCSKRMLLHSKRKPTSYCQHPAVSMCAPWPGRHLQTFYLLRQYLLNKAATTDFILGGCWHPRFELNIHKHSFVYTSAAWLGQQLDRTLTATKCIQRPILVEHLHKVPNDIVPYVWPTCLQISNTFTGSPYDRCRWF